MSEDLCKDVLKYTQQMTTQTIENESDYELFLEEWLKTTTYEEYKRMKQSGWNADTDFNYGQLIGVDADGDSSMSEEEFKKVQEALNQGKRLQIKEGKRYREVKEQINRYAISAWQACIVEKYTNQNKTVPDEEKNLALNDDLSKEGLASKFTLIGDDKVQIAMAFNTRHNEERPVIKQITVFGGKIIDEESCNEGETIIDTKVVFIQRDTQQALHVLILTTRGEIEFGLPAFNLEPIKLKRFVFQIYSNDILANKEYSLKIPAEYKSISINHANATPLFTVWPNTLQEWTFRTPSLVTYPPENRKGDWFIITAIFDPTDVWDVTIAKNSVENQSECEVKLPDEYQILSGACKLDIQWRDGDLLPNSNTYHKCETDMLVEFYPKDNSTFRVKKLGTCKFEPTNNNNPPTVLTVYALGIRFNNNQEIQYKIETKEKIYNNTPSLWEAVLQDSSFTSTGGYGFKFDPSVDFTIAAPNGYQFETFYKIGLKHPTIPILISGSEYRDIQ